MGDIHWFNPGMAQTIEQAQAASALVDTAVTQLVAGSVPDWSGSAATSAEQSAEEVQTLLLSGAADLEEALLLSAAMQQEWLLGRWSDGIFGTG